MPGDRPRAIQGEYTAGLGTGKCQDYENRDGSGLPGEFGLVDLVAMGVIEEIRVGLAGEAGVECRDWPNGLGG